MIKNGDKYMEWQYFFIQLTIYIWTEIFDYLGI